MWLLNKSGTASSRRQIQIKEVRDDILVLPNNKYRVLLETSSINFELKSEAEQDVTQEIYQTFLNSLPCELQIVVRTREVDIDQTIDTLKDRQDHEKTSVYKKQLKHYSAFLQRLVAGNKILSRRFYIVIPYQAAKNEDFSFIKEQLDLNTDIVIKGLERMGIKAKPLSSLEILNLFYSSYNPDQIKTQALQETTLQALLTNHV